MVFVLDDPKDPEDKKAKKPKKGKKGKEGKDALTAKNFGSRVDTSKFKQGSKLILAWRVRRGYKTRSRSYCSVLYSKH